VLPDIERAEHGRLGGAIALAMVDRIDQHRNPEYVRQQDELLPGRAAFLPDPGQKIDRMSPFVEAEIGLADEIVQRLHQLFHQEFDPRVGRLLKTADDGGGEFGVVELGHRSILGVREACAILHQPAGRGKHAGIGTEGAFRLDHPRQPGDQFPC